jgi:hypothetical protein
MALTLDITMSLDGFVAGVLGSPAVTHITYRPGPG